MRSFVFGALLGAFGATWAVGALPEPIENFLNDKVGQLAEMAGIERSGEPSPEPSQTSDEEPSAQAEAGASVYATMDALRRGGIFKDGHLTTVYTCPGMSIANEPATGSDGRLKNFKAKVSVNGVTLATAPVSFGCFASGYGPRGGRDHHGFDYHAEAGKSTVFAAGDGTVVEAVYRDDFGNMIVIDHGNGVYTRYAHLAKMASGINEGKAVDGTTKLGPMGQTASYTVANHLHYELLLGDFNTPARSFGLEARNIFTYPAVD